MNSDDISKASKVHAELLVKVIKSGRVAELKANPKKVIGDILGYTNPDDRNIAVLEESKHQGYIVIPNLPDDASSMSDAELYDIVLGGTCKNTGTLSLIHI